MRYEALEIPYPEKKGLVARLARSISWLLNARKDYLIQRVDVEERRGVAYLAANTKKGAEHKARKRLELK